MSFDRRLRGVLAFEVVVLQDNRPSGECEIDLATLREYILLVNGYSLATDRAWVELTAPQFHASSVVLSVPVMCLGEGDDAPRKWTPALPLAVGTRDWPRAMQIYSVLPCSLEALQTKVLAGLRRRCLARRKLQSRLVVVVVAIVLIQHHAAANAPALAIKLAKPLTPGITRESPEAPGGQLHIGPPPTGN